MNFTSPVFLFFYPPVFLLYRVVPKTVRWILLLAASLLFYWAGSRQALLLLLGVTLVTWWCGRAVDPEAEAPHRKLSLLAAWAVVLGLLIWFRYLQPGPAPAGISFYTFQSLGYCAQVYRGRLRPERRLLRVALFVSFFPQLVAGPIEQAQDLMPQLEQCPLPDRQDLRTGTAFFLRGYFKKICIADFAAPYVDSVFRTGARAIGPAAAAGTFLFALQIYADFSGYSDIARGSARLMGIRLSENFRMPYLAENLQDFWHRWHMTLTRWFTEMIYIPLGGSRKGQLRRCLVTLLIFTLSGLWHGAAGHFAAWGLLHGLLLVLEILSGRKWKRRALTFLVTTLAWIFFRAPTLKDALGMLQSLPFGWEQALPSMIRFFCAHTGTALRFLCMLPALVLLDFRFPAESVPGGFEGRLQENRFFILTACFLALMITCSWLGLLSEGTANAFIYFQF